MVRIYSEEEQTRRSLAIQQLDAEWTAQQLAAGVDGPVPAERREVSDYNLHVPQMEADGAALDEYFERLDEILR